MKNRIWIGSAVFLYVTGFAAWLGYLEFDLETIQLAALPAVILLLAFCRPGGVRLPQILLFICVAVLLAGFFRKKWIPAGKDTPEILAARLQDDPFDAQSYLFQKNLNEALSRLSVREVNPLHSAFDSVPAVVKFLEEHPKVEAVLWGSKNWLNLNFQKRAPFKMSPSTAGSLFLRFYGLKFCSTVSWSGLSAEPSWATIQFLSNLLAGYSTIDDYARRVNSTSAVFNRRHVLNAAGVPDAWRSRAHKALPYWIAGNFHAAEALQQTQYRQDLFEAAMNSYAEASAVLRPDQNMELYTAVLVNAGIVAFLRSEFEHSREFLDKSLSLLKRASSIDRKRPYGKDVRNLAVLARRDLDWIRRHNFHKRPGEKGLARKGKDGLNGKSGKKKKDKDRKKHKKRNKKQKTEVNNNDR